MPTSWRTEFLYVMLILLKLGLVIGLPMTALADAGYDDALFVRLGENIAAGQWLGDYNSLTLAKGAGYSIFLAIADRLHFPVPLAEQLLYVLFCLVMTRAFKPALPRAGARIFLFAVLLFNPVSFGTDQMARAIREGIYPAITGLVLAFAIGMALRANDSLRNLFRWAVGLGLSFGVFWLTREEGVWILPALACILLWGIFGFVRRYPADFPRRLTACGLAGAVALSVIGAEAGMNRGKYREFITVEFHEPAFIAAYGALTRVTPAEYKARVPLTRETRERIYAISPAFDKLRPYLDGDLGRRWEGYSQSVYPHLHGEVAAGWFMWELRDAVSAAGQAGSAKAAHRFYAQMAEQINAACDSGRIAAGPRRDTLMPPWRWKLLPRIEAAARGGLVQLVTFTPITTDIPPSTGTPPMLAEFAQFVHSPISDRPINHLDRDRLRIIGWIDAAYRSSGEIWICASLLVFLIQCGIIFFGWRSLLVGREIAVENWFGSRPPPCPPPEYREREKEDRVMRKGDCLVLWAPAAAMLVAILVRIALLALIDASSFPAILLVYLSCLHPLLLLFEVLMTLEAIRLARRMVFSAETTGSAPPGDTPAAATGR